MVNIKFVLASKNNKKLAELREILSELGIEVISQAEAGVNVEPEETGTTFEENAVIKARAVMEASGLPAISDDSGISVDALGGAPGVYSARYGGESGLKLDDVGRYELLLKNMEGREQRDAKYVCCIAAAFPNGDILTSTGECRGSIAYAPRGCGGFGYDPIFVLPDGRRMAEIDASEKNKISHRALALTEMKKKLSDYLR
jgi:XTP/dITP diphosphohydrolase